MKRVLPLIFITLLVLSFASAEMIINQQPEKIYNLGDSVVVPITVKTIAGVSGIFSMDLICSGKQINFYKNGVNLLPGEEKTMDASLVLTKELLGENVGTCKIKAILSTEYVLTNEFKISNILTIHPNTEKKEFEPGENILISGDVIKENGRVANGFIDLEIVVSNSSEKNIVQRGTINNGIYSINITFPEKMKAGKYLVKLNAYEVALDASTTNKGFVNYNIEIKQIPTSLELILEDETVKPGTDVKVKAILHDQTGEKIDSTAIITIKKGTTGIVEGGGPTEKETGEYMKLPIAYNEPPGNWTVFAISNYLNSEAHFVVSENEEIKADIENQTIIVTNIGNIPYSGTITIRMGNSSQEFNLSLGVDKTNKYELKTEYAGEYEIEFIDKEGESKLKDKVTLPESKVFGPTTNAIKDFSQSSSKQFFKRPLVWIFLTLLIFGVLFIILRKLKKNRNFKGKNSIPGGIFKKKINHNKTNTAWENRSIPLSKESKLKTTNKAKLSLSIKGNTQEVSVVNITIKNLGEVQEKKGNSEEPLQKIINLAENKKAFVYENQNHLSFILAPSKTKTFKNENSALEIAQDAKEILANYNRIAKYKLNFGISMEYGSIVERTENGIMEFMTLGTLMTNARKIASISQGEILLGENIKNKLTNVRTEKYENDKITAYKMRDIKYYDEGHSRYIKSFLNKKTGEDTKNLNNLQNKNTNNNTKTETSNDPKSLIKGFY